MPSSTGSQYQPTFCISEGSKAERSVGSRYWGFSPAELRLMKKPSVGPSMPGSTLKYDAMTSSLFTVME